MTINAVIFDIDGTLVDTNIFHVIAWEKALTRLGYQVERGKITEQIGKGGDLLVRSLLGEKGEEKDGDALRKISAQEFLAIAARETFAIYPGVDAVFDRLEEKGIKIALATSGEIKHVNAIFKSAGSNLKDRAQVVVTKDDAQKSKPEPDLLNATLGKLKLPAFNCALVGDTIYDAIAARKANVRFIGLLSGGTGTSRKEFVREGACLVFDNPGELLKNLDQLLTL